MTHKRAGIPKERRGNLLREGILLAHEDGVDISLSEFELSRGNPVIYIESQGRGYSYRIYDNAGTEYDPNGDDVVYSSPFLRKVPNSSSVQLTLSHLKSGNLTVPVRFVAGGYHYRVYSDGTGRKASQSTRQANRDLTGLLFNRENRQLRGELN